MALLLATLQGRGVEDLVGADLEQHRRTTRLRNGVIDTLSVLPPASGAASYLAVLDSAEARRQRDQAVTAPLHNRLQLAS